MYNNNYNARVVPEFMVYGGTPVGIPTGAVPQNATGGAIPQWALGQQNQNQDQPQPQPTTQFAQNNTQANDGNNLPFSFDDIYYSQSDNSGNILHKGTAEHEGGFSNRTNDLGGATNYGITQSSLNEYNSWNSPLKKGVDFPQNVKLLTPEQSKQIMDEMYYRRYGINNLNNLPIARNVFDEEVNQGTGAGYDLAYISNEYKGTNFAGSSIISEPLTNIVNSLRDDEIVPFNDLLSQKRMSRYFNSVDRHPQQNINNLNGWYNRVQSYYSNPLEFEKLYKNKVDYYINSKYPQYYNGK